MYDSPYISIQEACSIVDVSVSKMAKMFRQVQAQVEKENPYALKIKGKVNRQAFYRAIGWKPKENEVKKV